jgi:hypothetical protein
VNYIYAIPGTGTATFTYSTTAPVWSPTKGGWYNGNNRAIAKLYRDSGGYKNKEFLAVPESPVQIVTGTLVERITSNSYKSYSAGKYRFVLVGAGGGAGAGGAWRDDDRSDISPGTGGPGASGELIETMIESKIGFNADINCGAGGVGQTSESQTEGKGGLAGSNTSIIIRGYTIATTLTSSGGAGGGGGGRWMAGSNGGNGESSEYGTGGVGGTGSTGIVCCGESGTKKYTDINMNAGENPKSNVNGYGRDGSMGGSINGYSGGTGGTRNGTRNGGNGGIGCGGGSSWVDTIGGAFSTVKGGNGGGGYVEVYKIA